MAVTRIKTQDIAPAAVTPEKLLMAGQIYDFSSGTLRSAAASGSTDVSNKNDVDTKVAGLQPKTSVRAATTANITLSGAQTIDGVSVVATNRVLVKAQTAGSENGIYVAAAGAWARSTDMAAVSSGAGVYVTVNEGTVNGDQAFICTADSGSDVVGTNSLAWDKFSFTTDLVENETPSGTINGTNAAFTLAMTPITGSERLYKNGIRQRSGSGNDYTISGGTITFEAGNIPQTNDVLLADYRK